MTDLQLFLTILLLKKKRYEAKKFRCMIVYKYRVFRQYIKVTFFFTQNVKIRKEETYISRVKE